MRLLIALAIAGALAAQPQNESGLLLGVTHRAETPEGSDLREIQQLETTWIEFAATPPKPLVVTGLVIPRRDGFTRYAMQRVCETMNASTRLGCSDELVVLGSPRQQPRVDRWTPVPEQERLPCYFGIREVTFASPTLVSFRVTSGNNEDCEPRGYRGSVNSWVERLDASGEHVKLSEVAGAAAEDAYRRAGRRAYAAWRKAPSDTDNPDACQPHSEDSDWVIVRARTRWIPRLEQQPGFVYCQMGAPIDVALPESALGFREPNLSWSAVRRLFDDALEAHASPDGRVLVIARPSELLVVTRAGNVLARLPSRDIVMVQWALGARVVSWREALARIAG